MSKPSPTRKIETSILAVEHDSTSRMGNPTYRIITPDGSYRTPTNGSVGYGAGNFRPRAERDETGELVVIPVKVTLSLQTIRNEIRVTRIETR